MNRTDTNSYSLAAILAAAMTFGLLLPFALGALAPRFTNELGISPAQLGLLIAAIYATVATVSRLVGALTDRLPIRLAIALVFTSAAAGPFIVAAASSYALLWLAVVPGAFAAAASNPATNRVIAQHPDRQAILVGLKQSGVPAAALLAGTVVTLAGATLGWREAFVLAGLLAVAAIGLTRWIPPYRGGGASSPAAHSRSLGPFLKVIAAYAACMGAGMSTVTTYLALYAQGDLGFGTTSAGLMVALVGVGGIAARIGFSIDAERRVPTHQRIKVRLGALAIGAAAATAVLIGAQALTPWVLWPVAVALGLTSGGWNAVAMLALIRSTPPELTGQASGQVLRGFFLGLAVAPPLFGALIDSLGDFKAGWALTMLAFAAAILAAKRLPSGVTESRRSPGVSSIPKPQPGSSSS